MSTGPGETRPRHNQLLLDYKRAIQSNKYLFHNPFLAFFSDSILPDLLPDRRIPHFPGILLDAHKTGSAAIRNVEFPSPRSYVHLAPDSDESEVSQSWSIQVRRCNHALRTLVQWILPAVACEPLGKRLVWLHQRSIIPRTQPPYTLAPT